MLNQKVDLFITAKKFIKSFRALVLFLHLTIAYKW